MVLSGEADRAGCSTRYTRFSLEPLLTWCLDTAASTSTQLVPNRKKSKKRARTRPFRLDRGLAHSRSRSTNAERRTDYIPLRREAEKRKAELTSQALKLTKSYEEYGSTDGDWRLAPTKGRVVLPPGCAPRRSRRLNG
jgi:hypothetical protein